MLTLTNTLSLNNTPISSLSTHPTHPLFCFGTLDGKLYLTDNINYTIFQQHILTITDIKCTYNLLISCSNDKRVKILDLSTNKTTHNYQHTKEVQTIEHSMNNLYIGTDKLIHIDLRTNKRTTIHPTHTNNIKIIKNNIITTSNNKIIITDIRKHNYNIYAYNKRNIKEIEITENNILTLTGKEIIKFNLTDTQIIKHTDNIYNTFIQYKDNIIIATNKGIEITDRYKNTPIEYISKENINKIIIKDNKIIAAGNKIFIYEDL